MRALAFFMLAFYDGDSLDPDRASLAPLPAVRLNIRGDVGNSTIASALGYSDSHICTLHGMTSQNQSVYRFIICVTKFQR